MASKAAEEWDDVASETPTRVLFDTIDDELIGTYEGILHVEPQDGSEPFDLLTFRGTDGDLYSCSGYKLMQAFADIKIGSMCRIIYVKDVPTGKGNPMKDFKVQVKRNL